MSASPSTFVVLGLLAKKPGSGYDVAAFAERTISFFWPLSRSQLYAELSRIEELGWATGTAVAQERYPNKRVYEPTSKGLEALREWLDEPPRQGHQRTQDAVVLRAFLGSYMTPERLAEHLEAYREQAQAAHAALTAVVAHLDVKEPTQSHLFGRASARYGVLQAEATIAWTHEVQALLERRREPHAE